MPELKSVAASRLERLGQRIFLEYIGLAPEYSRRAGCLPSAFPDHFEQEDRMKSRAITLFSILLLASASAFASRCPADMKKIDEAMDKKPALSTAQMSEVKKLRADGEAQHKAGKHKESEDTLAKAMKILGI